LTRKALSWKSGRVLFGYKRHSFAKKGKAANLGLLICRNVKFLGGGKGNPAQEGVWGAYFCGEKVSFGKKGRKSGKILVRSGEKQHYTFQGEGKTNKLQPNPKSKKDESVLCEAGKRPKKK